MAGKNCVALSATGLLSLYICLFIYVNVYFIQKISLSRWVFERLGDDEIVQPFAWKGGAQRPQPTFDVCICLSIQGKNCILSTFLNLGVIGVVTVLGNRLLLHTLLFLCVFIYPFKIQYCLIMNYCYVMGERN